MVSGGIRNRCPECSTPYRLSSHYEYLVTGSEDSVQLQRLTLRCGIEEVRSFLAKERVRGVYGRDALGVLTDAISAEGLS